MQEIDSFQSSNQLCSIHKRARFCLASLSPDSNNPFLCNVCQFSNKQSIETLISIEEIFYADQTQPIQHWPQGIDEVSYDFLKNKQTSILKEEMQKGILKFYDELKSEIGKLLLDSQKKQLSFKIEEKKSNESEFREFQQNEILDLLDTLISKVNENAILMYSKEIDSSLFEEYSYLPIPTISEQQKIEESKNIKIINKCENKSTFMLQKQTIFDVKKSSRTFHKANQLKNRVRLLKRQTKRQTD